MERQRRPSALRGPASRGMLAMIERTRRWVPHAARPGRIAREGMWRRTGVVPGMASIVVLGLATGPVPVSSAAPAPAAPSRSAPPATRLTATGLAVHRRRPKRRPGVRDRGEPGYGHREGLRHGGLRRATGSQLWASRYNGP